MPEPKFKWRIQSPGPPTLYTPTRYSRCVANKPCILVGIIFTISTAALIFCLIRYGPPKMELTSRDFLTIGTDFSAKMVQYRSLTEHGDDIPTTIESSHTGNDQQSRPKRSPKHFSCATKPGFTGPGDYYPKGKAFAVYRMANSWKPQLPDNTTLLKSESVLNFVAVRSICKAERSLLQSTYFQEDCHKSMQDSTCLDSLSLPNVMSLYFNLSCCSHLAPSHVDKLKRILDICLPYSSNVSIVQCCKDGHCSCQDIPAVCLSPYLSLLYNYILPRSFSDSSSVEYLLTIFEYPSSKKAVFSLLENLNLFPVKLDAVYLNAEAYYQLYGDIVLRNTPWICLAFVGVVVVIWIHTYSFVLVVATVAAIGFSLSLAYFVNTLITGSNNFSMLNIMTVVLLLGTGPDDVFVMCSSWKKAKKDHRDSHLEKLVSDTIKHAGLSVTVTSFSTIAAFLANLISPVVAINAFAIYASLAVGFNLFFMLTAIPAAIVISESYCKCFSYDLINRYYVTVSAFVKRFYSEFMILLSQKLRYVVHLCGTSVLIFCFLSTVYYPGLRYPKQQRRSLFSSENPLETFLMRYTKSFRFQMTQIPVETVRVVIVWGVSPLDTRSRISPTDTVKINYNSQFDLRRNETRVWLQRFCSDDIHKAPHLYKVFPNMNCLFNYHGTAHLLQSFNLISTPFYCAGTTCCNITNPTVASYSQFTQCLRAYVVRAKTDYFSLYQKFKPFYFQNGILSAFLATYITDIPIDSNYTYLSKVTADIEEWFSKAMTNAPPGVSQAFLFMENMEEWELRRSLRSSVVNSAGAALLAAAVCIVITTLNPLLALQALIALVFTLAGTVTFLLWLDWRIDIVECVILTATFGLALDFTLHYGVAFKLHEEKVRFLRAKLVLKDIAAPISFGALTTAIAGALVLPSQVLVIRMTGIFLLTISSFAWAGALLIFPSTIVTLGSKNADLGQIPFPDCLNSHCIFTICGSDNQGERVDLTPYTSELPEMADHINDSACTEPSSVRLLANHSNLDSPIWKRRNHDSA